MNSQVSIVIPVHNGQRWITETLSTVVSQKYPSHLLEIVVVDDCSTDDSVRIATEFLARTDHHSKIIKLERNRGVSAARNVGWAASSGDWIQFLDSDDLLSSDKIAMQMAFASTLPEDVAVVYSTWQRIAWTGEAWRRYGSVVRPRLSPNPVLRIVTDHFGFVGPTIIRRRSLAEISGFKEDIRLAEDQHLMLRIAMAGGRFEEAPSPDPVFFYRQTPHSLARRSQTALELQAIENIKMAARFLQLRSEGMLSEEERRALAGACNWPLCLLFEHDRGAFRESLEWVRTIDPHYLPSDRRGVKMIARVIGYENAERTSLALRKVRHRMRMSPHGHQGAEPEHPPDDARFDELGSSSRSAVALGGTTGS